MSNQTKNDRNFIRVRNVLANKCRKENPLFGVFSAGFCDFLGEEGRKFLEKKGMEVFMKSARRYFDLITDPYQQNVIN